MSSALESEIGHKEKYLFESVIKMIHKDRCVNPTSELEWLILLERWNYDVNGAAHAELLPENPESGHFDSVLIVYPILQGCSLYDKVYQEVPCACVILLKTYYSEKGCAVRCRGDYAERLAGQIRDLAAELRENRERFIKTEKRVEELRRNAVFYRIL